MANKHEKFVEAAKPHLDAGEEILTSVLGAYDTKMFGSDTTLNGVLIATPRRVVLFAKRMTGFEMESYDSKSISSFESGKNLMDGSITFMASNNRVQVKRINPPDAAKDFVALVREKMQSAHAAAPPVSAPSEPDVFAKIQQLGQLRDVGVVTEEEFAAKKAELLAQI